MPLPGVEEQNEKRSNAARVLNSHCVIGYARQSLLYIFAYCTVQFYGKQDQGEIFQTKIHGASMQTAKVHSIISINKKQS